MAASWIRLSELSSSHSDLVCIPGQVQSINTLQRTFVLNDNTNRTSSINISFDNVRLSINSSLSGQYVQVYGKVIRQGGEVKRIDAQFIRLLGVNFDMNEYVEGLTLTRNYMAYAENRNENEDYSGNPIRNIL